MQANYSHQLKIYLLPQKAQSLLLNHTKDRIITSLEILCQTYLAEVELAFQTEFRQKEISIPMKLLQSPNYNLKKEPSIPTFLWIYKYNDSQIAKKNV